MDRSDEREVILHALVLARGVAKIAAKRLRVSLRTLLRRMRKYGIPVNAPSRPRIVFSGKQSLDDHAEMLWEDSLYWLSQPIEDRISAVETIREQTIPGYDSDTARLERVCYRSRISKSKVPRHRVTRSRRAR